jgi:hypothetical protein
MPTINLEMMKQLLQEFSEKEALTTEEINVIESEIVNLEQRIEFCRNKLKNLGADKEKLISMQQRYASSNSPAITKNKPPKATPKQPISQSKPNIAQTPAHDKEEHFAPESVAGLTPSVESQKPKQAPPNVGPTPTPTAPISSLGTILQEANRQPEESNQEEANADQEGTPTEGGDTIKSINDALKGLFRK